MNIAKGMTVTMSEELKRRLRENGSAEHVAEFGKCTGVVEGLVEWDKATHAEPGPEVNVRWQPSGLRYAYHPNDLQIFTDVRKTTTCDECGSLFFSDSSSMTNLCPECAHILYGYEKCIHSFVDGRCSLCHWDGSVSDHCRKLIRSKNT